MLGLKRFLLADEQSFVPRLSASTDGACGHTGSSAFPPSASLYRERPTLEPTEQSGVACVYAHDRPLLADIVEYLAQIQEKYVCNNDVM